MCARLLVPRRSRKRHKINHPIKRPQPPIHTNEALRAPGYRPLMMRTADDKRPLPDTTSMRVPCASFLGVLRTENTDFQAFRHNYGRQRRKGPSGGGGIGFPGVSGPFRPPAYAGRISGDGREPGRWPGAMRLMNRGVVPGRRPFTPANDAGERSLSFGSRNH